MRSVGLAVLCLALAACNRDSGSYSVSDAQYDPRLLTSSGGEVSLSDGTDFDYVITSDRYRQWDAARKGFSRDVSQRFGAILSPKAPTERSIERAITYVTNQAAARQAIERTGMTVRDFVLMTVALEQQMLLAEQRQPPEAMANLPLPMDTGYVDSLYPPGYAPSPYSRPLPAPYTPLPLDSARRVDTVYLPAPRDTMPIRRDSIRPRIDARDTIIRSDLSRPRIDTSRDSTRLPPRDSVRPSRDTTRPPRDTNPPPPPSPPDSLVRA
jgi:hypothetical protein